MKTGLTIQQMAQELLRQSKAKQDYLVNTGSLSLSVTSDAPQLRVTENGLDTVSPAAPVRTAFSTSLAATGTTRGRHART